MLNGQEGKLALIGLALSSLGDGLYAAARITDDGIRARALDAAMDSARAVLGSGDGADAEMSFSIRHRATLICALNVYGALSADESMCVAALAELGIDEDAARKAIGDLRGIRERRTFRLGDTVLVVHSGEPPVGAVPVGAA